MKRKLDPFRKIPDEICELILSFLHDVEDIKNASLVSKHWYKLIGTSKSCMKRIYLKPKESHSNYEFFKSIMDSTRIYQNLELNDRFRKVKRNTKYLRLMRDVVTKLAPTLVSLKISTDLIIKVDLPRLKELEINGCNYHSLISANGLLTKTKGLEILRIDNSDIDHKSVKYIRNFLMENDSLKVLKIDDNRPLHKLNSSNIKFRLEELYSSLLTPLPYEFYKVHSDSLRITNTSLTRDSMICFMTNFSKLHTLTLTGYFHRVDPFDIPFNSTIRTLKFNVSEYSLRDGQNNFLIVNLIEKVRNLQEIEITFLNRQIFRALINRQSLKSVKFRKCDLEQQDYDEIQFQDNIKFTML
ncbi:uncharacterized protein [Chironomus tepperi]|uniref:uncharacterized protein n=1 Tax=Chironomus tepperi TaxID=113505 RepID=UPI00391F77C4